MNIPCAHGRRARSPLTQSKTGLWALGAGMLLSAALAPLSGCRSPKYAPSGDPLVDLRNPNLFEGERDQAAVTAWAEVVAGVRDRQRTREEFKRLAWSQQSDPSLRLTTVSLLMSDTDPAGLDDSRRLAALMLPAEPSPAIVAELSAAAARHRWAELTPALVRSLSRDLPAFEPEARPERAALESLHPGRDLREVAYQTFLAPGSGGELRLEERARADAWELLSSLDPGAERRAALLDAPLPADTAEPARRAVEDLRRCRADLGVIPDSSMELEWLARLGGNTPEENARANARWWSEAAGAVARLRPEHRVGLALRHAEPVRWASIHRPAWASASRAELLSTLESRLEGRPRFARTAEMSAQRPAGKERLRDWDASLSWGDTLAILVIDEALSSPEVGARLGDMVALDREDRTTEYGGVLENASEPSADAFRLVMFRPRARDRTDDTWFVTSDDMLRYSDRALAHFHQHVQRAKNAKFAGPSDGDLDHARRSGRSCLVLTAVDDSRVNVDYYQPNGAVIDLGVISLE